MGCDFKVMKLIFPHWLVDFSDYFLVMHCISSEAKLTLLAESFMQSKENMYSLPHIQKVFFFTQENAVGKQITITVPMDIKLLKYQSYTYYTFLMRKEFPKAVKKLYCDLVLLPPKILRQGNGILKSKVQETINKVSMDTSRQPRFIDLIYQILLLFPISSEKFTN